MGSAYIQGFQRLLAGDSDAIGQMDADFSHDPAKVVELAKALEDCDIALGSRYVPGGSLDKGLALLAQMVIHFRQLLRAHHPGPAHPRHDRRLPPVEARDTGFHAAG